MKNVVISMILFIIFMLLMGIYMVYSTNENPKTAYYEQDLAYQKSIEAQKNVQNLNEKPKIEYKNQVLKITFSDEILNPQGKIEIQKTSDELQDKIFKLSGENVQSFTVASKGLHQIVLSWTSNGKTFEYQEKIVF
ncbi:MAG: hypothetical protein EAZ97_02555 [Bacteroidetes bacterium]|nr:MAG: hypothetical protein EAZ97_02555 [Bacteroidota bacterium]